MPPVDIDSSPRALWTAMEPISSGPPDAESRRASASIRVSPPRSSRTEPTHRDASVSMADSPNLMPRVAGQSLHESNSKFPIGSVHANHHAGKESAHQWATEAIDGPGMIVADDGDRAAVHRDGIDGVEELALRRVLVRQGNGPSSIARRSSRRRVRRKLSRSLLRTAWMYSLVNCFAGQVPDLGSSVTLLSSCTDSAEEMGLADAAVSVDEEHARGAVEILAEPGTPHRRRAGLNPRFRSGRVAVRSPADRGSRSRRPRRAVDRSGAGGGVVSTVVAVESPGCDRTPICTLMSSPSSARAAIWMASRKCPLDPVGDVAAGRPRPSGGHPPPRSRWFDQTTCPHLLEPTWRATSRPMRSVGLPAVSCSRGGLESLVRLVIARSLRIEEFDSSGYSAVSERPRRKTRGHDDRAPAGKPV